MPLSVRFDFHYHYQEAVDSSRVSAAMLEDRQIDVDAKAQAALEAARELERRKTLIQENAFALYEQFIEKARGMLQFPVETRVTTSETKEKRGKVIHQHITDQPCEMDVCRCRSHCC